MFCSELVFVGDGPVRPATICDGDRTGRTGPSPTDDEHKSTSKPTPPKCQYSSPFSPKLTKARET